jgi:hypothetical protein
MICLCRTRFLCHILLNVRIIKFLQFCVQYAKNHHVIKNISYELFLVHLYLPSNCHGSLSKYFDVGTFVQGLFILCMCNFQSSVLTLCKIGILMTCVNSDIKINFLEHGADCM